MTDRYPDWATEGRDWPNSAASSFVQAGGYRWHVQRMGSGPVCVLIHGTGAATHSWRDVMPLLAERYSVIAMDLPGHGFTRFVPGKRPTLEAMAEAVAALLDTLAAPPALVVGHSAGAAIGAQMLIDRGWNAPLMGLAPALMPFPGLAARLFPQLATLMFSNPVVSIIFSRMARSPGEAAKFLRRSTGSTIDARGEALYTRLFSTSGHCDGAIRMMANWRLEPLGQRIGALAGRVMLVHPSRDTAVPLSAVTAAAALIPGCETTEMRDLGHLAHEEDPARAVALIDAFARRHGVA
ncbi:alpha/beta fold hydrolase BchO [Sphingomonas sp. FW199]|uniref:alpha/beta fold hydrolase BchO n=1 Tax=Sphingomonas sp. FW199 TaxID=3400217 RepID=UPI003CF2E2FF